MAKGGRYLNKNKVKGRKKKGRGWKIALIVLAILAVLIGGIAIAAGSAFQGILDQIQRAEVKERDDVSDEDIQYFMTWNPEATNQDAESVTEAPAETAEPQTTETTGE